MYLSLTTCSQPCQSECSAYVPQRSSPDKGSYFFVYEITLKNEGQNTVQLRSRCWNITNADGKHEQVRCVTFLRCVALQVLCISCASIDDFGAVSTCGMCCRGPGVVGKYPILGPGTSFTYTSACPLTTPTGVMEGSYDFLFLDCDDEQLKSVPVSVAVAPFLLSTSVIGNINLDH